MARREGTGRDNRTDDWVKMVGTVCAIRFSTTIKTPGLRSGRIADPRSKEAKERFAPGVIMVLQPYYSYTYAIPLPTGPKGTARSRNGTRNIPGQPSLS